MAELYYSEDQFTSSGSEEDSDDDYVAGPARKRTCQANFKGRKKQKRVSKPTYIARITESPEEGLDLPNDDPRADEKEKNILEKIRKMMQLANHPGTGEAEAKAAMRRAARLMQQQNITQADLIANENEAERANRAGHSVVTITSTLGKMVRCQQWHNTACHAVFEAFDVQYYSENHDEGVDWVFYGLAENTVGAALAFEMLHNQIEIWALERKRELKGRSAHTSYCAGVAERVWEDIYSENQMALRKAEEEDEKRIRQEKEEAAAAIARLSGPIVPEPDANVVEEVKKQPRQPRVGIEDVPDKDDLRQNQKSAQSPKATRINIPSDVHPKKSPCHRVETSRLHGSEQARRPENAEEFSLQEGRSSALNSTGPADDDDDDNENEPAGGTMAIEPDFDRREKETDLDRELAEQIERKADQLDIKVKAERLEIKVKPELLDSKVGIKFEDHDIKPCIKHEGVEEQIRIKHEGVEEQIRIKTEEHDTSFQLQLPSSFTDDVKKESLDDETSTIHHWTSAVQLRTFRDNAKTIAENYLKEIGTKLYKGRKFKEIQYNRDAYDKGWEDGRKVDLKRRKIDDENSENGKDKK